MIYLDHAATSGPKPAAVVAAVLHWFTELGVSGSRGDGDRSRVVFRQVQAVRQALGALVGWPGDRVAFVSGATEGLNLVLRALLRPGDRVVTTAAEHAAVARPLHTLTTERSLTLVTVPTDPGGSVPTAALAAALAAAPTRLVVFTHASNVTGAVLDAAAIVAVSRAAGAWSVVDASQTAGWLDLRCDADVVVASAHKALQGPPGLGFVALRPGRELLPQKQGGTGSGRTEAVHPVAWPAAFEAGTPNTPAILGLGAALDGVATPATQAAALQRALARVDQLALGLADDPRWRLLPPTSSLRTPILSLVPRDYEPSELGAILADADVHVRSGFHCAPWIHAHLGTVAGGTVRISPGADTTAADIDRVLALLHRL